MCTLLAEKNSRRDKPIDMLKKFHPANIFSVLDAIDQNSPSYTLSRRQALRRVFWILASVSVCLLIIHYMKYFSSFRVTLSLLSEFKGHPENYYLLKLKQSGFLNLLGYSWWTAWHVVGYVLLPFLCVKYILKESFSNMGWRWHDTHKHWFGYVLLLSPILFFIFLVSFRSDFLQHYPFYKLAHRSWVDLILWELMYLLQFICLEFFFRGYILQGLRPAIGANAIWVMCVPYLMIHFPKLWLEATGAILFGLFLGILALRSRSIWGGFFVHAGVAVSMDLTSLIRQGKVPDFVFPVL